MFDQKEIIKSFINEFVSGGPKNYAYRGVTSESKEFSECKVRGFTLDSVASDVINFESLKSQVTRLINGIIQEDIFVTNPYKIQHQGVCNVISRQLVKRYKAVYDKRYTLKDFSTRPWGWQGT